MEYYVYVWKTPIEIKLKNTTILPGSPIYVGKGKSARAEKHLREAAFDRYNELKSTAVDRILGAGETPLIEIVRTFENEKDAFALERELIHCYGKLVDRTGTLTNLTDGGEGASGFKHSEETKAYWSKIRKGVEPYNKGTKRPGVGGRKKGTTWSADERIIKEEIFKNRDNSSFRTEEFRSRMSKMWKDGFSTGKIKHAATGKKWYNNGTEQTYFVEGEQPPGWHLGRLKMQTNNKQGMVWFNNGEENKQFRQGEEPEEFVRGRIKTKH